VTLGVLLAGAFAAVVILFTGMVGYIIQLFRRQGGSQPAGPMPPSARRSPMGRGDVIDVVATQVPANPAKH
jgi:hypothetical protein